MEDVRNFTSDEKIAFLAALHFASKLNGVTIQEEEFIRNLAEDFDVSKKEAEKALFPYSREEITEMLGVFTERRHQLELVKELFFLGYADGNLSDEELASFETEAADDENNLVQTVKLLRVADRTKSSDSEDLCLTSCEQT